MCAVNLKLFLEDKARRFKDRTAVVCADVTLSYAGLDNASNRIANWLIEAGVRKGDRVAILLPNCAEFAIIYLGTVKIGAVAVPLDARYKPGELLTLFDQCQPRVLAAQSDCLEGLATALPSFKSIERVIEIGSQFKGRFASYAEIMETSPAKRIEFEAEPPDLAHIGYTSGPTSHPRGVMLSHHNIITEAGIAARGFEQTEKDVMMLFALPMHHVFGLVIGLLATFINGGKVVILPGLSLSSLMESTEKEKGTIFMGVPYVYVLMVHFVEQEGIKYDLSSLRLCISGGSCLPDKIALKFKRLYGRDIGQVWGLTEAAANVTCTPLDGTWKMGSAGRVLSGWEMKVVDDYGRELPPGEPGEVIVRGPIMQGYYNNPEDTAQAITDGWLHTGDISRIDGDGDLFITGLKKKMIIVKGQNIYPVDIERVLHAHPQVAEAAVIGVPDELRGETIGAAIRLQRGERATDEEIKRFCRQHLINYKIPKRILFLEDIPRNPDGEVGKEKLIELFLKTAALFPDSG